MRRRVRALIFAEADLEEDVFKDYDVGCSISEFLKLDHEIH